MPFTQSKRVIDTLPGSIPDAKVPLHTDTEAVAEEYIPVLGRLDRADLTEGAIWRDLFALTGTGRSIYSSKCIAFAWANVCPIHNPSGFILVPGSSRRVEVGESSWVEARFVFETNGQPATLCSGFISLVPDQFGQWKIWLLRTILEGLKGCPNVDILRPHEDRRQTTPAEYVNGTENRFSVDCVVVGAGQGGLSTAGRLHALGVNYILIEKNPNVGDSWKIRYESAKLHTVRAYAHLPFERTFGPTYPEFLTKYDLSEGFRAWASRYNINIWCSTSFESGSWNGDKQRWTLRIKQNGRERLVDSAHLVLALGMGGQVPVIPSFPGRGKFKGVVLHSADYTDASAWAGKVGVVIGTANTGHDVAEDMLAANLSPVTMVQRSDTYVLPVEHYMKVIGTIYNDTTPTELSDRIYFGNPMAIGRQISKYHLHKQVRADYARFDDLERAGFKLERFGDISYHVNERGGGHYIDVGVSAKISTGLIKMKSDATISGYTENGLVFDDGSTLEADVIVLTTGFVGGIRETVATKLGEDIASQVEEYWGLDAEGEIRGAFKPTGHRGLWYCGGPFGHTRFLSRFIALHIKADLLHTPLAVYQGGKSGSS